MINHKSTLNEEERSISTDRGNRKTSADPFVSVIMPVRNEVDFIERSVRSVICQDYPSECIEILIADGMSEDGTREIIRALQQEHSNLKLVDNPGKIVASGLNTALLQATGEIIVRVDGHCEVAPDYVSRCVGHLVNDEVDAVGGPVTTIGESTTARAIAAAMSSSFGVGGSAFRIPNSRTQFTDTVAFPAYRRSLIDLGGAFDQELVRNQDDEYNYRLRKLGVSILLASDVRSRYYSRANLRKLGSQYFQYGYWKVRVMQKHPRQMQLRQLVPLLFVLSLLSLLIASPLFPLASYLAALLLGAYVVAAAAASILSVNGEWKLLPIVPLAFATIHFSYGLGFLFGFLKFWNRWGEKQDQSGSGAVFTT